MLDYLNAIGHLRGSVSAPANHSDYEPTMAALYDLSDATMLSRTTADAFLATQPPPPSLHTRFGTLDCDGPVVPVGPGG
jgi:hypothetical protein